MSNNHELFGQLSESDQKVAIDLTVACSLLVSRLPHMSGNIFDAVMSEFSHQYEVPNNVAKYSLRALGKELFHSSWQYKITKCDDNTIATHFTPGASETSLAS